MEGIEREEHRREKRFTLSAASFEFPEEEEDQEI